MEATRAIQIPMLSAMLTGGCLAKARRAIRERSVSAGLSPTAMFPLRLRRPVAVCMCVSELGLGIGLILTAGRFGAGLPADAVRAATALLFLIAVGGLHVLRSRRPGAGCGCFGDLSDSPIGARTITRSVVLCLASAAAVGVPPLRSPSWPGQAGITGTLIVAELAIIAALSPELGAVMVRLGYSEPCELRRLSIERTVAALRGTAQWRRYRHQVSARTPVDVWREGCWRYLVFPATVDGRAVELVFAVYMKARRPPVRSAMLDAASGEVLSGAGALAAAPLRPAPALPAPRLSHPRPRHRASAHF